MAAEKTYEVSLVFNSARVEQTVILRNLLINIGIKPQHIIELSQNGTTSLSVYTHSHQKNSSIRRQLKAFRLNNVELKTRSLLKKDWQTKWKKEFKPFFLTKRFEVVPGWQKKTYKPKGNPVYIDTSLAFGTGLHATTRFMAAFIERLEGKFKSFLDIGTGTGILAIIAAKCGAKQVEAIDISRDAVAIARANCLRNNLRIINPKVKDFSRYTTKKQYDFVAANLITQDLITFKKEISALVFPGGYLAVSGISLSNYNLFRSQMKSLPFRCVKTEKGEGWVGLLYQKKR